MPYRRLLPSGFKQTTFLDQVPVSAIGPVVEPGLAVWWESLGIQRRADLLLEAKRLGHKSPTAGDCWEMLRIQAEKFDPPRHPLEAARPEFAAEVSRRDQLRRLVAG